ncbi:MAG: creatininase family protein [Candidatus Nezhaarchaeota archaeon]|nr:creatininase family protein [Candidatus Nezhaarchaeota archaeon]MCX8142413.1 creatininase family protein [Candidatus Nezhaarchaeota archaeon]MDW8050614.1 creatininase family protein [Nitrososphaerota archaeon]
MKALRLAELSWIELKKLIDEGLDTVFVPVGTVEAHGKHLPLGTDFYIAERIAEIMCSKVGGVMAPTVPYGVTRSLIGYPGSLTLTSNTFKLLIKEVAVALGRKGFKFIIFVNGHGGNTDYIKEAIREAYLEVGVKGVLVDWWIAAKSVIEKHYPVGHGHALAEETAALMATRPDLLKRELYDEEDYVTYQEGFWAYPLPASALAYKKEKPEIDFDLDKAIKFLNEVGEYLANEVKRVIEKWRKIG